MALLLGGTVGAVAGAGTAVAQGGPTSFTFNGSGWGHGVGMSQYGARGMAIGGSTYPQILAHYYRGTTLSTVTENAGHKVIVAPPAPTFTLTAGTSMTVTGNAGAVLGTAGPGAVVTLRRAGQGIVVEGAVRGLAGNVGVRFTGPVRISPPNRRYAYGTVNVVPDGTANLKTRVDELTLTQVLYGLGEMPSLWPTEALRTQAVAARTFAQKRRAANGELRAWMDISYVGYDKETGGSFDRWKAAVDSTVGKVVTYNGGLIDALFSASSGGYTEDSEYVFVAALPYLRSTPDPGDLVAGNPHASWTETFTAAELGSWFEVGTATAVQVVGNVSVAGRTNRATVRVVGTTGTRELPSLTFRNTVAARSPSRALISPKFSVAGPSSPPPPPPAAPRVPVMATGAIGVARASGSTIMVSGTATDPDGTPLVRVVSTMGTTSATRETRASGGRWSVSWTGSRGTRKVCASVVDAPTGRSVPLGCRDVVVK